MSRTYRYDVRLEICIQVILILLLLGWANNASGGPVEGPILSDAAKRDRQVSDPPPPNALNPQKPIPGLSGPVI